MKIVGVAACTAGIAHTYMAREKLIKGAKARGHECVVETQGTIGPGIRSLSSVSQQGQSRITVEFELSVDLETAYSTDGLGYHLQNGWLDIRADCRS